MILIKHRMRASQGLSRSNKGRNITAGSGFRLPRLLAGIALILLIQSCTNSKLIISPLYNRLDDRMRSRFDEMGDFNDEQKAAFNQRVGTYHVWHRQSELPLYADLMQELAASIAQGDTEPSDVQRWMEDAEFRALKVRECHPINFSFDLMKSLTDEQVVDIEDRFYKEEQEDRERWGSRTPEERIERRIRNMVKWAGRIDLDITPTQRAMLLTALKQQISLREEYRELSDEWDRQFFTLLEQRDSSDFDNEMSAHLSRRSGLLENAYPEQWQANSDLWKNTTMRVLGSMSDEQRSTASRWLEKMARTLQAISKNEPSFKVTNDPALGCLVDSDDV